MKSYIVYTRYWIGATYKDSVVAAFPYKSAAKQALKEYQRDGGEYYIKEHISPKRKKV